MHSQWPQLFYQDYKETYFTLHRWLQIIGKIKLNKAPCPNHSWHASFRLTSSGMTTMPFPDQDRTLTIDFDFLSHSITFTTSDGDHVTRDLRSESVSDFYERIKKTLDFLNVNAQFSARPNELPDAIPFYKDTQHCEYDPFYAQDLWQAMTKVDVALSKFRARFVGKASEPLFFWGSFDLACSRFSGRRAPEHPGGIPHLPDKVVKEAYSQELFTCGFWPGNEIYPHPAFFCYIYPEPNEFAKDELRNKTAFYHQNLGEYILPYEAVALSTNPEAVLLEFLDECYQKASRLGNWEKEKLESDAYLLRLQAKNSATH